MDELVVDDGCRQRTILLVGSCVIRRRVFEAHYAALAHYVAVFLAGNFFRHLKHHLDQGIHRKGVRPVEQDAALADVFDNALMPRTGFVNSVAERDVELQATRARYPRRTLFASVAAPNHGVWLGMLHPFSAAHGR